MHVENFQNSQFFFLKNIILTVNVMENRNFHHNYLISMILCLQFHKNETVSAHLSLFSILFTLLRNWTMYFSHKIFILFLPFRFFLFFRCPFSKTLFNPTLFIEGFRLNGHSTALHTVFLKKACKLGFLSICIKLEILLTSCFQTEKKSVLLSNKCTFKITLF